MRLIAIFIYESIKYLVKVLAHLGYQFEPSGKLKALKETARRFIIRMFLIVDLSRHTGIRMAMLLMGKVSHMFLFFPLKMIYFPYFY